MNFLDHRLVQNIPIIYGLKDPEDDHFRYVGQAVDPEARYKQHLDGRHYAGTFGKARWMEKMKAAGVQPELVILQRCSSFEEADAAEREWKRKLIEEDHPLVNSADGGARVRSGSKFRAARKRDWIELGYTLKCAREATMQSLHELSGMLPKGASEVASLRSAMKSIDSAMNLLDERIYKEYPKWKDFLNVFYGCADKHAAELGADHAEADRETRRAVMTRADVEKLMDDVQGLNYFGIGVFDPNSKTATQRAADLDRGRRELLDSVETCNKVCVWLADVDRTQSVNERVGSSYHLKHVVEEDIGSVSNGTFIAAAIFCGFRYRIDPGSPNVWFAMSAKSIKAIEARRPVAH